MQRKEYPEQRKQCDDDQQTAVVIGNLDFLPAELESQIADELIRESGNAVRGCRLEELLRRCLLDEQHFRMGEEVYEGVRQSGRVTHARLSQRLDLGGQPGLFRIGGRGGVQVQLLGEPGDLPGQRPVVRLLRKPHHVCRRQRQVAVRVADDGVAGLEALDTLLLRIDRADIGVYRVGQPVRQVGDAVGGFRQIGLQARHAGDEGGQGIEVCKRIGLDARDLDAPVGREPLDLLNDVDRLAVVLLAAVVGHHVDDARRRQENDGNDSTNYECARSHCENSLDSPASVLIKATMASLSSSGASRPSWNSNIASTASRNVAAVPSWR